MMNIWIRWFYGYRAYVDMKKLALRRGYIYFYNEKGDVVECSLTDSVQFDMRVNCGFRMTKSCCNPNYSKGDVFAVRHKGDEYDLYIPMSEVNFVKSHFNEKNINAGMNTLLTRRCGFNGSNLSFWNPRCNNKHFQIYKSTKGERILFDIHIGTKQTEKGKYIEELSRTIREECDVNIGTYDMSKILEKFKIEKL